MGVNRHLGKGAVTIVVEQLRRADRGGKEKVRKSIVVVIAPRVSDGWPYRLDAGLERHFGKGAVAVVVKKAVGCFPVEQPAEICGHKKIEQPVAVVIHP